MSELYKKLPDEEFGLRLSLLVVGAAIGSAVLRALDFALLATRPRLFGAYARLWARGLWRTPYSVPAFAKVHAARRSGKSASELTYGETPVVTAWRLFRRAGVGPGSFVIDLGAGRGRVLFAARLLGARARGVELLPAHVDAARFELERIGAEMALGDVAEERLVDASCVFVAWTCFSEATRARVAMRLRELREGARVLVLNWPLEQPGFELLWRGRVLCSWGRAPVYLYERRA